MKSIERATAARHKAIKHDDAKGFTLIELLVVVIIIGILAAIAIPVFLTQRQAAWKAGVESDLKNTALLVETYAASNKGSISGANTKVTPVKSGINVVKIVVSGQKYTICGSNKNLAKKLTYNSSTGGLKGAVFVNGAC